MPHRKMSVLDRRDFEDGYGAFDSNQPYPNPDLFDEWYVSGWLKAQADAGLDPASIRKLSKQLKALGFTIPNEEN